MTGTELIIALYASDLDLDLPIWHDGGGDPYCAGEITEIRVVAPSPGMKLMGHENNTPDQWIELS